MDTAQQKVDRVIMIIALPLSLPHIGVIWTVSMHRKMLKGIATEINWSGHDQTINGVNASETTTMITNQNMELLAMQIYSQMMHFSPVCLCSVRESVPCYAEAHGTSAMNTVFIKRLKILC